MSNFDFDDTDDLEDNRECITCWSCFFPSRNDEKNSEDDSHGKRHSAEKGLKYEKSLNIHSKVRQKRRVVVTAPLDTTGEDFKAPNFPKSTEENKFISSALMDNFVFSSLSQEQIKILIGAMEKKEIPAGTIIIKQDDIGDYFYVLEKGVVDFIVDGKNVGKCTKGGSFGELALLYHCPRNASCVADTDCSLFKVDQYTFRFIVAEMREKENQDIADTLQKLTIFSEYERNILIKAVDLFETVTFEQDDVLYSKGDPGNALYIVSQGSVKMSELGDGDSPYEDVVYNAGDFFGEVALTSRNPRAGTATVISDTADFFCLNRSDFENLFDFSEACIEENFKRNFFRSASIFSSANLKNHEIQRLKNMCTKTTLSQGDSVVKLGEPCLQGIYLISSGKVAVESACGQKNLLGKRDYFGADIIHDSTHPSNVTVTILEETECILWSKKNLLSVLGSIDRLNEIKFLQKSKKVFTLASLKRKHILGAGTFGKVWLVVHKKSKDTFALKELSKKEIIAYKQISGVIREKNVMEAVSHPFLLTLVASFQDSTSLYLLTNLVQGGELYKRISCRNSGGVPNSDATFYSACVFECLSYLHDRQICYRDLKPENVMIDKKGYCVMVDFGFAKKLSDKTYTFCGTPEYIAPEIILSKGHDQAVDWWAYGILVYELLVGVTPFFNRNDMDQVSLFKRILKAKYTFPKNVVNESAQDLIQKFLVKKPSERLGYLVDRHNDVRNHEWFDLIDAEQLLKKEIKAPWVPSIKNTLDKSNFDDFSHLEKQRKETITEKQQALFKGF